MLLEAVKLTKIFESRKGFRKVFIKAVDRVSFSITEEDPIILNIVGESGSGKTTIARMLLGLIRPTKGEVRYKGKNIYKLTKKEWQSYRKDVQMIFQDPYGIYNPNYRIDRTLILAAKKFNLASSEAERHKLIVKALEEVGLRPKDVLGRYPHQLSGGERQRIMLARIWMIKPKVIVADEPVSMIDASLRAIFLNILLNFKEKYRTSIVFITHNFPIAYYLGGQMIVLYKGKAVEEGPTDSIIKNPLHPYVKLLLKCIPPLNPHNRWKDRLNLRVKSMIESHRAEKGCIFYDRCMESLEICKEEEPALHTFKDRKVACHLYY